MGLGGIYVIRLCCTVFDLNIRFTTSVKQEINIVSNIDDTTLKLAIISFVNQIHMCKLPVYVCKKCITINGKRQYLDLFQLSLRVGFILLSILSSQRSSFFDLCFKKCVNRVLGHKRNSRY